MKRFRWIMALAALCMLATACGGSSSKSSSGGSSTTPTARNVAGKLVVDNESGSTWTCQFNPFNPAVTLVSFGWIYEPLEYVNILKSGATTPWLATTSKLSNCAPQNIKYLNNPHYWQSTSGHPVPAVKEVDYPAFLSNTSANLVLAQGGAQWGGQYIPNIQSFYIAKDPAHRHYWFAPVLNVSLFPNLTNPVLSQLPVRQAISLAIDRATVSRLGESGYQAPANQTGVVLPTFSSWSDSSLTQTTHDPAKAMQTLTSAGFTK